MSTSDRRITASTRSMRSQVARSGAILLEGPSIQLLLLPTESSMWVRKTTASMLLAQIMGASCGALQRAGKSMLHLLCQMAWSLPAHPITSCTVSICPARHHKFSGSHDLYIVWNGVQCVALHPFSVGRAGRLRRPQVVVQVCVLRVLARTQNTHLYKRTVCGCAAALAPTGHPASCLSPKIRMMPIFTALAPTYSDAL